MYHTIKHRKRALITGAGKGLGRNLAIECAECGYDLILVSLPQSGTISLAYNLEKSYGVKAKVFEMDLTQEENIYQIAAYVNDGLSLDLLINNAGCGGSGLFEDSSLELIDLVIKLNIRVTALLTRSLIPALERAKGKAHVMNISSMAAFSPMGYKHVYPASKAFIYAFTMGLREEFKAKNISFSTVHPGPMLTNSDVSKRILKQGSVAGICLVNTRSIAKSAIKETMAGKAVIIPGIINKITYYIMRLLPSTFVNRMLTQGIKKELTVTDFMAVTTKKAIA